MTFTAAQLDAMTSLKLAALPVALAFLPGPPPGLSRIDAGDPAGCSYWKRASEGQAFYTGPEDHTNCPIGAYTHGVPLTAEQGAQLQSMLGTMIELKYIKSEEVPAIPHRTAALQVVAYAPLAQATFAPDVVIFRGNVSQIMLLAEAARAAGVFESGSVMGRPACAMVPQALDASQSVASLGCIGNRVYTGLGEHEMYLTVPGSAVASVLDALEATLNANRELEKFHRGRLAQ